MRTRTREHRFAPQHVISARMSRWPWPVFLAAYAVVPIVLLTIAALPAGVKVQYCILDLWHPALVPMALMHFTHSEISHLASNISFYLFTITALLLLETNKRRFFWIAASFFSVLPLLLSVLSIWFLPHFGPSRWAQGFSGVVFAFFGYATALAVIGVYQRFFRRVQEGWAKLYGPLRVCAFLDIACLDAVIFFVILYLGITFGRIGPGNGLAHFSGYAAGALAPVSISAFWKQSDGLANLHLLLILTATINLYVLYGIQAASVIG